MAKTVLIADDSSSVCLSVRLLLQVRHRELVAREAVDGVDALEKAKKSKPDLILLDMPRLNGAEAATVLKNDSLVILIYDVTTSCTSMLYPEPSALTSFQKLMVFPNC